MPRRDGRRHTLHVQTGKAADFLRDHDANDKTREGADRDAGSDAAG